MNTLIFKSNYLLKTILNLNYCNNNNIETNVFSCLKMKNVMWVSRYLCFVTAKLLVHKWFFPTYMHSLFINENPHHSCYQMRSWSWWTAEVVNHISQNWDHNFTSQRKKGMFILISGTFSETSAEVLASIAKWAHRIHTGLSICHLQWLKHAVWHHKQ